ncbi:MAG: hypothetical protein JNN05_00210 [Candidatus Omnitrophica bacterium]|nr:hypothetical protein [Candidatus Omnitrophota bacterium]
MNKYFAGWLDFAVRVFIVGFTSYLVVSACFMSDYKRMTAMINNFESQVIAFNEQARVIAYLGSMDNPDSLYQLAMIDDQHQDYTAAAQKVVRVLQLAEFNYNQKYKVKFNEYVSRGLIKTAAP